MARFEISLNGKPVCTSGIDGTGVLSANVSYVRHPYDDGTFEIHIGGLGNYHPVEDTQQHVSWSKPEIGAGDTISIRLLEAGKFDLPLGMFGHPSTSLDSTVFGSMSYYIDSWHGEFTIDHDLLKLLRLKVRSSANGPTKEQESLFTSFVEKLDSLWPDFVDALVRCHPEIEISNELTDRLVSEASLAIDDDSNELELSFLLRDDKPNRCYFVKIRDWNVVEVASGS